MPNGSADTPNGASEFEIQSEEAERLRAAGFAPDAVQALVERSAEEVHSGLLPAVQIAMARDRELVFERRLGTSAPDSLICVFSATKALTAAAFWLLLERNLLDLDSRVVDFVPEFDTHGKDAVRVRHLLTHSAGFPHAPFRPLDWLDPERRRARYAQWRLNFTPGSQYEYHPSSSMWVLAELIERVTKVPFTRFIQQEVLAPLELDELFLGDLPPAVQARVLPVAMVGDPATAEDYAAAGLPEPPVTEVTDDAMLSFNRPEVRSVGMPGGGAVASAAGLALLQQALLHGSLTGASLWQPETLMLARRVPYPQHRDPYLGCTADRGLGLSLAGTGESERLLRGFAPQCSPESFGHNGAGGQLAWIDPQTGLSFGYATSGHDRNSLRQAARSQALNRAAANTVR